MPKTIALVVAGGQGKRARLARPKQYFTVQGSTLLAHALRRMLAVPAIDHVLPVIGKDDGHYYHRVKEEIGAHPRLLAPVTGGGERQDSVQAGLAALESLAPDFVLVHDAARPWVSVGLVKRLLVALDTHPAVVPAMAITDTVKRCDGGWVRETLERAALRAVQTPQAFHFPLLVEAYAAREPARVYTDEAAVCEARGVAVYCIEGERSNKKVTTYEDIMSLEEAMNKPREEEMRVGLGFDAHRFTVPQAQKSLMLGGVEVPHVQGVIAHSDGDVLLHALVDAMLGAIGEGDIGLLFPSTDAQYKDKASSVFVKTVLEMVHHRQGRIVNVDLILIAEAPRLGLYRHQIQESIADILSIERERVNVKATTTEKMGFTGRKEGIAAQAVISIALPVNKS